MRQTRSWMTSEIIFLIYHFKGGLVKTSQAANYKLIPNKDAPLDIAILFRVLVRNCLIPDWVSNLSY